MKRSRPRLLWVTDEVPHADLGGGSIRQYQMLRHISPHADIDLMLVGEIGDESVLEYVRQATVLGRPPPPPAAREDRLGTAHRRAQNLSSLLPGRRPTEVALNRRVVKALRSALMPLSHPYDLVQVEHESLAGVIPRRRTGRWAITLHHLISVRSRHCAAIAEKQRVKFLFGAEARKAEQWERQIKSRFDLTIVTSENDAAALRGGAVVVPNGVDLDKFVPTPLPGEPRLLFSASFNYEPNADAAVWLCHDLLPRIRAKIPDATVVLVGRQAGPRVQSLAGIEGVEAHFDVESVVPYLQSARVCLAPLRQGSGTRLKALEAMAAARPVAGTTIGVEGLPLENETSAVIADDPDRLAEGIARLCTDEVTAEGIGSAGRKIVEDRFGWDRIAETYLVQVVERVLDSPRLARTP